MSDDGRVVGGNGEIPLEGGFSQGGGLTLATAALDRRVSERVSQRTRDARQAIHVAHLCDTEEEVDRFESGNEPGRLF